MNGGSAVDVLQVEAGKKATKPTDPTRVSYTFAGWYKEVALSNAFDFNQAITTDITLYAKWEVEGATSTYTVTFEVNEGSAVDVLQVEAREKATKPTDPTRTGYTFAGWYKEVALSNAFDFNQAITTDITLYAKWEVEGTTSTYTVTFEVNGGSAVDVLQVEAGKKATKPTDPTRTDYTFAGWYKEVALTNAFNFETETITGNITLYAKWLPEGTAIHTVTFDSREGTTVAELKIEAGKQATKPTDPIRTGYTFDGWYKEVALTNVFDFSKETITGNITLYAKWLPEETAIHTVTFEVNGGSAVDVLQVEAGKKATKPTDPTRTSYTFVGWYKEVALTNAFNFETETITGNITLYAKWLPEGTAIHTVTFEVNGGATVAELKVETGKQATKPTDPTRTSYTFVGWYKEVALTNAFNFETETITGNITLYAKWLPEGTAIHTVTFDSREGTTVAELKIEAGKQATKPADPTRTDYTFDGWYKEVALTNAFNFETETITGNITLYAKWEVRKVSVIFIRIGNLGPDDPLGTQEITSGTALDLSIFALPPYGLSDLYTDEKGEQKFDRETVIEANQTLYIKWEAVPRTNAALKMFVDAGIEEQGDGADLNYINTKYMTDMSEIFKTKTSFNGNISEWDVAAVRDMGSMFSSAFAFNQDISGWNVAAVTNMANMFFNAIVFDQDISGWNVAAVTNMGAMFSGVSAFNGDISGWNVAAVTNMAYMFINASAFNRDLTNWNVATSVNKLNMFINSGVSSDNNNIPSWY